MKRNGGSDTPVATTQRDRTRSRILDAAADVMRRLGLVRATTKEIAKAAGYSEASLYKHFKDKDDLFFGVLTERLPIFAGALLAVAEERGGRTVQDRLTHIATAALGFYSESLPIAVSLLSDPEALARHRMRMTSSDRGPQKANEALVAYLRTEQQHGRIASHANLNAAATLLFGACFHRVFLMIYHGEKLAPTALKRVATEIVETLMDGLAPPDRRSN